MATAVLDVAKVALPPAPSGWITGNDSESSAPTRLCADQDSVPWTYGVTRTYQRIDDQEARTKVLQDAATEYSAALAAKQPKLDAIMARMTPLSQEVAAAAQKSDWARVEELNKEMEKISAEYKQVMDEGGANEKMQAAATEASQDRDMMITITANSGFESVGQGAEEFPKPAATRAAYRWSEKRGDADADQILVLLGDWAPATDGHVEAAPRPDASAPVAQTLSVRVSAAAGRITQLVETIDFNALAGALSK